MSKTQLKKELAGLNKDQLQQLILDLYGARKEAKAWFDFFVNPDIDKLTEKFQNEIEKELNRGKYTKSTARISRVRSSIRDYASYGVDAESLIKLMVFTLKMGLRVERTKYVSKTFMAGMVRLAEDILKEGDKKEVFDFAFSQLGEALNGSYGYLGFVNHIRRSIDWSLLDTRRS